MAEGTEPHYGFVGDLSVLGRSWSEYAVKIYGYNCFSHPCVKLEKMCIKHHIKLSYVVFKFKQV